MTTTTANVTAELQCIISLMEDAHAKGKNSLTLYNETPGFNALTLETQQALTRNQFNLSYSYDALGKYAEQVVISW